MLDVGWTELVVIAIVMIIVVGPKDLPPMLRTFGKMMTKMRGMAGEFRQQFDEALKEADLDDVRKTLSDAQKLNPAHSIREAMNPLRQMGNDIKADLQKASAVETKPKEPVVPAPAEVSAQAVVPDEQPKSDPLAAVATASDARQADGAAETKPEKPKAKRVSNLKTVMPKTATTESVGATSMMVVSVKTPGKKARAATGEAPNPDVRKAAAKTTKKKGDA